MTTTIQFSFPTDRGKQKIIVGHFPFKSSVGLYIDGILIWTNKPTKPVLEEAKLGAKNYSVEETEDLK